MKNIMKDKNGKQSSKRLLGSICIGTGLLLALSVGVIYIIVSLNRNTPPEISELRFIFTSVFSAGTVLLGSGVFEKGGNYEKNK